MHYSGTIAMAHHPERQHDILPLGNPVMYPTLRYAGQPTSTLDSDNYRIGSNVHG